MVDLCFAYVHLISTIAPFFQEHNKITGLYPTYATRRHVSNNWTEEGTVGQRTDHDDGTEGDGRTEDGRRRRDG